MNKVLISIFVLLLFVTVGSGQQPVEGYLQTPDRVKLFYKIEGSGSETLVMVHGGPGNSLESIRADMSPLTKGRRVIYYDQRGQGRSELITDGKKLGYPQHVSDLEAVRKHFNLEKMTLMGNSWGGLLISLYAVAHPDRVERMILDSAAPPTLGFLVEMQDELGMRMERMYTPAQRDRYRFLANSENWVKAKDPVAVCREFYSLVLAPYAYSRSMDIGLKADLCVGSVESVRQQQTLNGHVWRSLGNFDLIPKLGLVKAPVLVIHGVADVIPLRSSESWAGGYPNARLLVIQKAGHMAQVEAPEVFFPAIEAFLKGNLPAGATKVELPHGL